MDEMRVIVDLLCERKMIKIGRTNFRNHESIESLLLIESLVLALLGVAACPLCGDTSAYALGVRSLFQAFNEILACSLGSHTTCTLGGVTIGVIHLGTSSSPSMSFRTWANRQTNHGTW